MATKKATATRASARLALPIDCESSALRNLMTEQCRIPSGFATFYCGSREQFIDAGFPEVHLPRPAGRRTKFRIAPSGRCFQAEADAWLTPDDGGLELEIHWSPSGPGGCGHPALTEAARMALNSMMYFLTPIGWDSNEMPIERLLGCKAATDYQMSPEKRWAYTPEFRNALSDLHHSLFCAIQRGEVMPAKATAVPPSLAPDSVSLDAERMASSLIATAKGSSGTRGQM